MRVVSWYYGILGLTGSLLKVAVVDNEGPQDRHGKANDGTHHHGYRNRPAGCRRRDIHRHHPDERQQTQRTPHRDLHGVEPRRHHPGHRRSEYDVAANRQYRGNHTYVNVMITTGEFPHFPPAMG